MKTPDLTFEQGVAVGIMMNDESKRVIKLAISGDPQFPLEDMLNPVKGGRIFRQHIINKLKNISTIEFPTGIPEEVIDRADEVVLRQGLRAGMG